MSDSTSGFRNRHFWAGALAGIVITALAAFVLLNWPGGEAPERWNLASSPAIGEPHFQRALQAVTGPPLVGGNRVEVLENGVEIFPSMLEAIGSARRTINFETFVYWSGDVATEFAEALAERARSGVEVRVLLDWVGSQKMQPELIEMMRQAGAEVVRYQPPGWLDFDDVNNRTHRKLLIVDGRIGFTGGVGIADEWTGDAQGPDQWRDLHFRIEGPVVAQLQSIFVDNWLEVREEALISEEFYPPLAEAGPVLAQAVGSAPEEQHDGIQLVYLHAISGARHRLAIGTAYFVPDAMSRAALAAAAERGVRVQIIVPGPLIDSEMSRRASRANWGGMLAAGVEIYEFQPTMYHAKLMVVDGLFASVGSTNFDHRSFHLNDESNLNVLSPEVAGQLERIFAGDLERARRVTFEEWHNRPWTTKLWERMNALLSSQL